MGHLTWDEKMNLGIDVIDNQHRRIVEYINTLDQAVEAGDQASVKEVLEDLVDYTVAHFAFEESLQERVHYEFFERHQRVHDEFRHKILNYQTRFLSGEDIAQALLDDLQVWLVTHIKEDDADYVGSAIQHSDRIGEGWVSKVVAKLFG